MNGSSRVRLYLSESEGSIVIVTRRVHRESNLRFTLSSEIAKKKNRFLIRFRSVQMDLNTVLKSLILSKFRTILLAFGYNE